MLSPVAKDQKHKSDVNWTSENVDETSVEKKKETILLEKKNTTYAKYNTGWDTEWT